MRNEQTAGKTYIKQILQQHVRLVLRHPVDPLGESPVDIHRFPPSHSYHRQSAVYQIKRDKRTIRPNNRMHSLQLLTHIQRRPPHPLPQRIPQPPRLIMEETRIMRRRQPLQEGRHRRRQSIVDLVRRRPEGIAARRREGVNLEHGVVRRHMLEADVRVPADGGEAAGVAELVGEAASFLLLLAADDADLVT